MYYAITGCQAGTVASRTVVSAARINATIVPSTVQAPAGNIVMQPTQSTVVVGPAAVNSIQPPMTVVGGRIIATSTSATKVPRPVVPTNASVTGMLLQINF